MITKMIKNVENKINTHWHFGVRNVESRVFAENFGSPIAEHLSALKMCFNLC